MLGPMIAPLPVPSWCRVRRGGSALLLVAPHGGTRRTLPPVGRRARVNDLHTAALAEELAGELDAGLIANPVLDRNQLDLNRISQVAREARWFPALLEELLAEILARHERAQVLFLHGWNTGRAACDVGIGTPLRDEREAAAHSALLTTSPGYVATRLAALRVACAVHGIAVSFGERYPARHHDNVLQLFRRQARATAALAPRLSAWAAAGRIEAVQLELGVPLRWPGAPRAAFRAALCAALTTPPREPGRPTAARRVPPAIGLAATLQAYDPAAGVGLVARVEAPAPDGRVAGRVLLFLGPTGVALFTGDAPATASPGWPRFADAEDGLRFTFDGWALRTDDGGRYVDLEQALAASRLLAMRADLAFTRITGERGRVRGTLALDGAARPFDAVGFSPAVATPAAGDVGWRALLSVQADLDDGVVAVRHRVPGGTLVRDHGAAPRRGAALAVTFGGEPHTPRRIVVADGAGELVVTPIGRMAIVRPLAPGRHARVTFGVARVRRGTARGFGFYEYARVVD